MKKLIFIFLFLPIIGYGQTQLFEVDSSNKIVATLNSDNTIGLKLNDKEMNRILTLRKDSFSLSVPFFGSNIILNLERYQSYSDKVLTRIKTRNGDKDIMITPQLLSYKLMYDGNSIGILNFVNNQINATFLIDNKQYEISKYKNKYVIFDVNNSINQSNFSCDVNQKINSTPNEMPNIGISAPLATPVCIETAIEIDHYTRNTFSTNQETLDWALANISGVSQLYQAQTNAEIQVVHVTIWDIVDPYDTCSSPGSVLTQIRDHWMSNNSAINRDHVHFLSKRGLSGGVTYGSGLCQINWHYAVSTALGPDTSFAFPNPIYSWNLNLIAHELGHNIGSAHTHWCGWGADTTYGFIGGGIDNCAVSAGYANACSPPAPSPDSAGTIMSYCHLSVQAIILEFHDIVVSQALIPGLSNASCVIMCNSDGCTDSAAFNYNPSALTDDGSCIYIVYGCSDSLACNYDYLVTLDDSSCIYDIINQQAFLICDEDSIVVGASVYDIAGNYIDTLSAFNSCDSIIYTNLLVNNNSYSFDTLVSFVSIIWNGISLSVSGDYSAMLINSVGCDSIVSLNLTITNSTSIEESTNNKKLISITNFLGQKTSFRKNTSLFYIYDDGTVEKKIILE